jgi:hypothetical protein
MRRFAIDERYEGDLLPGGEAIRAGHVHHVSEGGKDETERTRVALFFCARVGAGAGSDARWHVQCQVSRNALAPSAEWFKDEFVAALKREGVCSGVVEVSLPGSHKGVGNDGETRASGELK